MGMSEALGTMVYGETKGRCFWAFCDYTQECFEATMQKVDEEIRENYRSAICIGQRIAETNRTRSRQWQKHCLNMKLDAEQLDDIMEGKAPGHQNLQPGKMASAAGSGSYCF